METPEDILLNSLANSGVPIPAGVSSVQDLTPSTLFALCSHVLRLIGDPLRTLTLPEDSMSDRVKAASDIASDFRNLGFAADLSFHKFLYPSEEDLYELVRFLVGRLSEFSESGVAAVGNGNEVRRVSKEEASVGGKYLQNERIFAKMNDLRLKTQKSQDELAVSDQRNRVSADCIAGVDESRAAEEKLNQAESSPGDDHKNSSQRAQILRNNGLWDKDGSQSGVLKNNKEMIKEPIDSKYSELQEREQELVLLKAAAEMVFDDQHPVEFYVEKLNNQVEAKRHKLKELESEWDEIEKPLQEKKKNLEQSMLSLNPEACGNLRRRKEIELETESVLAEIKRREEEICKLSSDLEKQPKLAPRRSYIERIKETTKNSQKLDADIQRILKDTRELQLESNTIQERLNRTYAVVDETIFREAKKDPIARQAYRLLSKIHQSFEQIAEDILATDRCRRDAANYEAKLANVRARSMNMDKVQDDLDAIRKENDLLKKKLGHV